jgi:hypothetical protein
VSPIDWVGWHRAYEDADSPLYRRLQQVRAQIRAALDAAPPGPLRAYAGLLPEEVAFAAPAGEIYTVGSHRHIGVPRALEPDARLFTAFRS